MSAWKLANDIEEVSFRLESIKSMIEIIAEGINDHHSNALWGCTDSLGIYIEKLEKLANDAMDISRAEKLVVKKTTKGKKK
jgi:hypothetical protein